MLLKRKKRLPFGQPLSLGSHNKFKLQATNL